MADELERRTFKAIRRHAQNCLDGYTPPRDRLRALCRVAIAALDYHRDRDRAGAKPSLLEARLVEEWNRQGPDDG